MGLVAEYRIAYEHLPLVDVAAAVPEATLELDVGQPNRSGPPTLVVRATGGSVPDLEAAFEAAEYVRAYSLVYRDEVTRQYRVHATADHWETFVAGTDRPSEFGDLSWNESIVERIEVRPEGWVQERRFADREAFEDYCAFWRETGTFSLRRLTESGADSDPGPEAMTDRQWEALSTAHEMGYFEVPREATLTEVAAELGVSAPSLSERLRRAQSHLVEDARKDLKGLTN